MAETHKPIQAFHEKHGPDFLSDDNGWLLWPDGARRENSPYGIMIEPDPDRHKRARDKCRYWQLRVDRAVSEFDHLKAGLQMAANASIRDGAIVPDSRALDELKSLKAEVERLRSRLRSAERGVERTVPEAVKRRAAERAERQAAGREFDGELSRITI